MAKKSGKIRPGRGRWERLNLPSSSASDFSQPRRPKTMKKSRVVSNALNNPKAGYSQLARLEPTVFWRRSRRLQLTALEQLSLVLDSKAKNDPHTEKRTLPCLLLLPERRPREGG